MVYSSKTLSESYNDTKSISEIIYETEYNWNTLMKAMNVVETSSIRKHGEVIYEAVDIKAFFRKIKEFFKNLFEKIRGVFIRLGMKFKSRKQPIDLKNNANLQHLKIPDNFEISNWKKFAHLDIITNFYSANFSEYLKDIPNIPSICCDVPMTDDDKKSLNDFLKHNHNDYYESYINGRLLGLEKPISTNDMDELLKTYFITTTDTITVKQTDLDEAIKYLNSQEANQDPAQITKNIMSWLNSNEQIIYKQITDIANIHKIDERTKIYNYINEYWKLSTHAVTYGTKIVHGWEHALYAKIDQNKNLIKDLARANDIDLK